jgi:hypothetical protein
MSRLGLEYMDNEKNVDYVWRWLGMSSIYRDYTQIRHDDSMGESFPDFFGCSRAVFVQIRWENFSGGEVWKLVLGSKTKGKSSGKHQFQCHSLQSMPSLSFSLSDDHRQRFFRPLSVVSTPQWSLSVRNRMPFSHVRLIYGMWGYEEFMVYIMTTRHIMNVMWGLYAYVMMTPWVEVFRIFWGALDFQLGTACHFPC